MNDYMSPKQVVEQLDISTEALKKYSLLLEKNGMEIDRNKRGHRQYSKENVKNIKALIFLNKEKSVNLDEAASMVTTSDFDFNIINVTSTVTNDEVITLQNNGMTVHNELAVTVINQLQLLKNENDQRDMRTAEFQKIITERLEEQRDLIVSQEEKIEELKQLLLEENKKPFWKKLFSK